MVTKKLALLSTTDRDGFLGTPLTLEIPHSIKRYSDALKYLKPTLSSKEFIDIMYQSDYNGWLEDLNEGREDPFVLSDFSLNSIEFVSGVCRWTFYTENKKEELTIYKSMEFVTHIEGVN